MIDGSCCCGAIQFRLTEIPSMMGTCHCSRCRKLGASTMVFVKQQSFQWIQGRDSLARYEPEPSFKYVRTFCRKCGTALGELESQDESFPVVANCLDHDPQVRNGFHEFVADKPAWYDICDGAPQSQGHPTKS